MAEPLTQASVAIIGAGWAGLAAAVELADRGVNATVFDAAAVAGGRARRLTVELDGIACELDNGQHLLIGAYRDTLSVLALIGALTKVQRRPLQLRSSSGLNMRARHLPAPWHLASAMMFSTGLSWQQRWQMLRLFAGLRFSGWRVLPGSTVAQLLRSKGQSDLLTAILWQPLCVATLNTDIDEACAQTFATVLRDTLGADRAASDFILAQPNLSALLVDPAIQWLAAKGVNLQLRNAVRAIEPCGDGTGWLLRTEQGQQSFRSVILAIPPSNAARLLATLLAARSDDETPALSKGIVASVIGSQGIVTQGSVTQSIVTHAIVNQLESFRYEPIATCYLAWPADQVKALPPWIMLEESVQRQAYGQWLFDRGEFEAGSAAAGSNCGRSIRVAAVVVSAAARALLRESSGDRNTIAMLGQAIGRQVRVQLGLAPAIDSRTIVEKRATFRCTPDRPKMQADTLVKTDPRLAGLWLAGDYCWSPYPATLEAAVRSGLAAARLVINGESG